MTRQEARAAWGDPRAINRTASARHSLEQWCYGNYGGNYIYFSVAGSAPSRTEATNPRAMDLQQGLDELAAITSRFDEIERALPCRCMEVSVPIPLEGTFMTQTRLLRGVEDQVSGDPATLSRYAIWAETLRGAVIHAAEEVAQGRASEDTRRILVRVANSLAAFCEIQAKLDPLR